jgi:hypothetical protein
MSPRPEWKSSGDGLWDCTPAPALPRTPSSSVKLSTVTDSLTVEITELRNDMGVARSASSKDCSPSRATTRELVERICQVARGSAVTIVGARIPTHFSHWLFP